MSEENQIRILLTEDDENLGSLLCEYLNARGYKTDLARNGEEGIKKYGENNYDLCLLDVMMPVMDGFTMAKEIRSIDNHIPIIFLTAKNMKEDTLEGFRSGADDYITKPFSMEELLLRVKALMRRTHLVNEERDVETVISLGNLIYDANHRTLTCKEDVHKLTSKENALLNLLSSNMNKTVQRDTALKVIWGDNNYFNARSMDVYVAKLRKHLKLDPQIQIINVHGEGFRLTTNNPVQ